MSEGEKPDGADVALWCSREPQPLPPGAQEPGCPPNQGKGASPLYPCADRSLAWDCPGEGTSLRTAAPFGEGQASGGNSAVTRHSDARRQLEERRLSPSGILGTAPYTQGTPSGQPVSFSSAPCTPDSFPPLLRLQGWMVIPRLLFKMFHSKHKPSGENNPI